MRLEDGAKADMSNKERVLPVLFKPFKCLIGLRKFIYFYLVPERKYPILLSAARGLLSSA